MLRRSMLLGSATSLIASQSFATICPPDCGSNIVAFWDNAATSRIKYNPQLGPIGDALMGAGLHTAIYNAWTAYSPKALPTLGSVLRVPVEERTEENKRKAISYAAHAFLTDRFQDTDSLNYFNGLMKDMGYINPPTDGSPNSIGINSALNVIEWRKNDGSNYKGKYADQTGYVPTNASLEFCNPSNSVPNQGWHNPENIFAWSPLKNPAGVVQKFAGAQMGTVIPHTINTTELEAFKVLLDKPAYLKDIQLYKAECDKSIALSAGLTPNQKLLVEFWADGPGSTYFPTAHWRYFTKYVADSHSYNTDETVKLYYAVATAAADAGIMTWLQKRNVEMVHDQLLVLRTIYDNKKIRAWGGPGHSTEEIYGNTWSPFNPSDPNLTVAHQSPGFPGWPSGHTMFSSACSKVLRDFTGSDRFDFHIIIPENFGIVENGNPQKPTPINFKTFSEAAQSATNSRLWSGIHFAPDCSPHVMSIGEKVGDIAWAKAKKYFND